VGVLFFLWVWVCFFSSVRGLGDSRLSVLRVCVCFLFVCVVFFFLLVCAGRQMAIEKNEQGRGRAAAAAHNQKKRRAPAPLSLPPIKHPPPWPPAAPSRMSTRLVSGRTGSRSRTAVSGGGVGGVRGRWRGRDEREGRVVGREREWGAPPAPSKMGATLPGGRGGLGQPTTTPRA
jgi:hypothetical protein